MVSFSNLTRTCINTIRSAAGTARAPEEPCIALERIPQSTVRCRSRLSELQKGGYECGICFEGIDQESRIWHCNRCGVMYHHGCILDWAKAGWHLAEEDTLSPFCWWNCPSCRDGYEGNPLLTCWCGVSCGLGDEPDVNLNSCGGPCNLGRRACSHLSAQVCHQGPCERCPGCPLPAREISIATAPTAHLVISSRSDGRTPIVPQPTQAAVVNGDLPDMRFGFDMERHSSFSTIGEPDPRSLHGLLITASFWNMIFPIAIVAFTCVILEPYNHLTLAENFYARQAVRAVIVFAGFVVFTLNRKIFTKWAAQSVTQRLSVAYLDLFRQAWHERAFGKVISTSLKILCAMTRLIVLMALISWPLIGAIITPFIVKTLAFEDVCNGFDTSVILDDKSILQSPLFRDPGSNISYKMTIVDHSRGSLSKTSFELSDYNPNFAPLFGFPASSFPPQAPDDFSRFYHILYDWDLQTWTSYFGRQGHDAGSFFLIDDQHLVLPDLGLQIPYFVRDVQRRAFEPYLKAHRIPISQIGNSTLLWQQARETNWEDNGDVVLRSTAYGERHNALRLCARREDVYGNGGELRLKGLGESLPVVAGVLAVERWRADKKGGRGKAVEYF